MGRPGGGRHAEGGGRGPGGTRCCLHECFGRQAYEHTSMPHAARTSHEGTSACGVMLGLALGSPLPVTFGTRLPPLGHRHALPAPGLGLSFLALSKRRPHNTSLPSLPPLLQVIDMHREFLRRAVSGLLLDAPRPLGLMVGVAQCASGFARHMAALWDRLQEGIEMASKAVQVRLVVCAVGMGGSRVGSAVRGATGCRVH